jgi:hypothetical protein
VRLAQAFGDALVLAVAGPGGVLGGGQFLLDGR